MKGKIFNAQEVQAILAGNKTQFREVVKPQPKNTEYCGKNSLGAFIFHEKEMRDYVELIHSPYQVGQKIFVKEAVDYREHYSINNYHHYTAWKKQPASRMKQEHSRLTLRIKEIRVERLGDISGEDCWSDGLDTSSDYADWAVRQAVKENQPEVAAKDYFREKWNATHKKPEEKFEANPWVWCVEFEIVNK